MASIFSSSSPLYTTALSKGRTETVTLTAPLLPASTFFTVPVFGGPPVMVAKKPKIPPLFCLI